MKIEDKWFLHGFLRQYKLEKIHPKFQSISGQICTRKRDENFAPRLLPYEPLRRSHAPRRMEKPWILPHAPLRVVLCTLVHNYM